ncbi:hypothetical protein EGR_00292 [Echinococcus granulosus]|uniref:Uncharacterized protein n=1 Tax=Echinococcus granulosus TaxID=6210 RepID=W6UUR2_ECHGR|nr:hypothetical protein EGR_00292 [Echinococcus granulosus]EUB65023.1 hypothetical protein EGR_00292 [Echinococcus granulosus]
MKRKSQSMDWLWRFLKAVIRGRELNAEKSPIRLQPHDLAPKLLTKIWNFEAEVEILSKLVVKKRYYSSVNKKYPSARTLEKAEPMKKMGLMTVKKGAAKLWR